MDRYIKKILICALIGFPLLFYTGRVLVASKSNSQTESSNISLSSINTQQNPTSDQIKKPTLDKLLIISTSLEAFPDNSSKLVSYEDNVDLFAIVKDSQGNYYLGGDNSLPAKIKVDNIIYSIESGSLKRWNEELWGKLAIKWYKIMPRMQPSHPDSDYKWYSNVFTAKGPDEGKFSGWDIIEYTESSLSKEGWTVRLKKEIGTARFRAEVNYNGKLLSSPGQEDPSQPSNIAAEDYDRGIKPSVHSISRLSNHKNKLIRYMEALRGVPWLWGADYRGKRDEPTNHQSELPNPIGIECADLVVSALRAMGNKDLQYTAVKELEKGIYNLPLDKRIFKFFPNEIFKNWTPQGIAYKDGYYYISGKGKIQIFDKNFRLKKVIENPLSYYLDIAVSQDNQIYAINDSKDREIEILDEEGNLKNHFRPKIESISEVGGQFYTWEKEIRARGIGLDEETRDIYLLDSDSVYIFDEEENFKKEVKLEGLYEDFIPVGPLSLENGQIYIPIYENEILIYNLTGRIINKIPLKYTASALDIEDEKYHLIPYLATTIPLCIEVRNMEGALLTNSYERFIDEEGKDAVIHIGTLEGEIRIGDLILTKEEKEKNFSDTRVFYEDSNKNGLLDYSDKLIGAGHEGVIINSVKEKLEKRSFILRRLDESLIKIEEY